MKEKKIAREERNQEKLANGDWVMAEFYATWCPHCQRMKPVVEEFKKLMVGTLEVVEVDIDQEPALTDFYTVESTPTFILFVRKGIFGEEGAGLKFVNGGSFFPMLSVIWSRLPAGWLIAEKHIFVQLRAKTAF